MKIFSQITVFICLFSTLCVAFPQLTQLPEGTTLILEHQWNSKKDALDFPRLQLNFERVEGALRLTEVFDQHNVKRVLRVTRQSYDNNGKFSVSLADKTTPQSTWTAVLKGDLWAGALSLMDAKTRHTSRVLKLERKLIYKNDDIATIKLLQNAEPNELLEIVERKSGTDFLIKVGARKIWIRYHLVDGKKTYSLAEENRRFESALYENEETLQLLQEVVSKLSLAIPDVHTKWASAIEGYHCFPHTSSGVQLFYIWYEILHGRLVVHGVEKHYQTDVTRDPSVLYPRVDVSKVTLRDNGTATITTDLGILEFTPLSSKDGALFSSLLMFNLKRESVELTSGFDHVGQHIHISGVDGEVPAVVYSHFKKTGDLIAPPAQPCHTQMVKGKKLAEDS